MSNIIAEKTNYYNYAYNNQSKILNKLVSPENENNFVYQVIKSAEKKKPKILNKGFILDEHSNKSEERINKLNEKINSMKKMQDNIS